MAAFARCDGVAPSQSSNAGIASLQLSAHTKKPSVKRGEHCHWQSGQSEARLCQLRGFSHVRWFPASTSGLHRAQSCRISTHPEIQNQPGNSNVRADCSSLGTNYSPQSLANYSACSAVRRGGRLGPGPKARRPRSGIFSARRLCRRQRRRPAPPRLVHAVLCCDTSICSRAARY